MTQNVASGVTGSIVYGFETTYGTAITPARTFGHGIKGSVSAKNNMERIFGLGSRNATTEIAKKFEISGGVEFVLSQGTFLRAVLGAVADGGASPYTHTYSEANTLPSMTLQYGGDLGTNDLSYTVSGAKINSCTITGAVGEVAKVKLDYLAKSVSVDTSGFIAQVAPTEDVYSFQQGTLEAPNGSTIANVQNVEITINNSLELIWGLGDRTATTNVPKQREYNIKITIVISDVTTFMSTFLGDSSNPYTPGSTVAPFATLRLTFDNGLSTSSTRKIVMSFANFYLDEDSFNLDPNEVIKEDVTGHALSCSSVVWSNNTAADNASP